MTNKPMLSAERLATQKFAIANALIARSGQHLMPDVIDQLTDELTAEMTTGPSSWAFRPQASQHQDNTVAARVAGCTPRIGIVELRLSGGIPTWLELHDSVTVIAGDVQHHVRSVAAKLPFVEQIISKLQRFEACVNDGQDVDIERHWFDMLTHLGLLNRVQRSPALWEMTHQGEDALQLAIRKGNSQ